VRSARTPILAERTQFCFVGADAGQAALHDAEAILQNPAWAMLTYESTEDKEATPLPRRWYNRVEYRVVCPKPRPDDQHCDEYPFFTSVEGGPGASLKIVPEGDNVAEGIALKRMQYDRDCNMARDASGAKTQPGSFTQRFFVVPVAVGEPGGIVTGMPSFHVCGNPKFPVPGDPT
jgi:hypothetical protein